MTVDGERTEFSLQRKLEARLWDDYRKRGKGRSPYITSLNSYLDQTYRGLFETYRELMLEGKVITPLKVKSRYFGVDEKSKTLKEFIDYHNATMYTSIKAGTRKNYFSTERCIDQFLKEKYKVEDIQLKKLDYSFIMDFEQYLRSYRISTRRACNNNGVMKHMERLKKMSRLAVRLGWVTKDPSKITN
ncbi:phage integrase SAM-like domain and Arm DNA-binding domain-containing protein [Flavivirga aquimarina]|uniref:Phage integrase SAM-like domain and Arm DNA-binding domain-containing protein n=1 Tax=Flavivirga aquimarina TaxID=2027862 RepID=A0ABT8WFM0_9FLAO|nr:phage integrase SAM-like domain and Arm DNA-binding domain-containing protein [Flavivirga aquimarina]MDO5971913.1 phage integrase SAM-like domain and Arm DNA-binding domain-containing protein [Flavivirga aquimarina]